MNQLLLVGGPPDRVRLEADRIEGEGGGSRFRRRRALDHSADSEHLVLLAVALVLDPSAGLTATVLGSEETNRPASPGERRRFSRVDVASSLY